MLCKKCQIWADTIQVKSHQPPWQHCHHEEPEKDYQKPWREAAEKMATWAENHYWDSLEKDKDLIVKHIKESFCSGEKPKEKSDNPYKIMLELCLNNLQSEISKARKKI